MRGEEGKGEGERGVVSCRARAVQLLGSVSDTSLRSLASRADILRRGWSLRRTKPRLFAEWLGGTSPQVFHRCFQTSPCSLPLPSSSALFMYFPVAYAWAPRNVIRLRRRRTASVGCASLSVRHCEETRAVQTAAVEVQTVAQRLFGCSSGLRKWRFCTSQ